MANQADYRLWKKNIPICYDFFVNNNLILPSPCLRWGHVLREDSTSLIQRMYYTERGGDPNTIVIANVKINKCRTSDPTKMVWCPPQAPVNPLFTER